MLETTIKAFHTINIGECKNPVGLTSGEPRVHIIDPLYRRPIIQNTPSNDAIENSSQTSEIDGALKINSFHLHRNYCTYLHTKQTYVV